MELAISLCYTPDLAHAVDAAGLAAYGIDAQPASLAAMRAAAAVVPGARGAQRVYLVSAAALGERRRGAAAALRALRGNAHGAGAAVVLVGPDAALASWERLAAAAVAEVPPAPALAALVRSALETARLRTELAAARRVAKQARAALAVRDTVLTELQHVAIALSTERDSSVLQRLILTKSRELTAADAGSLYLLEDDPEQGGQRLRFQWAQNDSVAVEFHEEGVTIPLSPHSMAGYVALTGQALNLPDVYDLPPGVPYRFNAAFDRATGYRSRSMLLVPMVNHDGEVVGVIQLINRKRHFAAKLDSPAAIEREVIPFDEACGRLLHAFASQAAVALDNQQLLENIQRLFDGFVDASIQAIESRDPTTSGHSKRVAEFSVALAEATTACREGPLADVVFSNAELRELRYAALLHDFGKVGVREHVLIKAKKLYPWQLQLIEERFATVRALLVAQQAREDVRLLLRAGVEAYRARQAEREAALAARLANLERDLAIVRICNEPTVLPEDRREQLAELAARRFVDVDGAERALLEPAEVEMLSIPRGSLNDEERREIESHVTHTVRFLSLIPWTKDLRNIVTIAGAHHEKLNGQGYPRALAAPDIPVQSRIMTIVDIYDALTARDRPYKRAVPVEVALRILRQEAAAGLIDQPLLDLFIGQGVYEVVRPPREEEEAELAAL